MQPQFPSTEPQPEPHPQLGGESQSRDRTPRARQRASVQDLMLNMYRFNDEALRLVTFQIVAEMERRQLDTRDPTIRRFILDLPNLRTDELEQCNKEISEHCEEQDYSYDVRSDSS